jgi:hypothetical protein
LKRCHANVLQRGTVGAKPVRDDGPGPTITLDRAFQELERSLAIPLFCDENFKDFAFVVNGAPEIEHLAVDLYEGLVEVPAPE